MQKTPQCLLNPSSHITNKILLLKEKCMLLPWCVYFYGIFFIDYFNRCYLIKYITKCENFEINILKIEICLTIANKNESAENIFYLLFAGFKNYMSQTNSHSCFIL